MVEIEGKRQNIGIPQNIEQVEEQINQTQVSQMSAIMEEGKEKKQGV